MTIHDRAHLLRDFTRDLLLAGRGWRKIARGIAAAHGISEASAAPLVWIERLGDNVRQNVLAEAVGIEGASLVRLLDELEKSGLVARSTDPADRRANTVSLTEAGSGMVHDVNDDLMALRTQVFADIPDADIEAALRTLGAIITSASQDRAPMQISE